MRKVTKIGSRERICVCVECERRVVGPTTARVALKHRPTEAGECIPGCCVLKVALSPLSSELLALLRKNARHLPNRCRQLATLSNRTQRTERSSCASICIINAFITNVIETKCFGSRRRLQTLSGLNRFSASAIIYMHVKYLCADRNV